VKIACTYGEGRGQRHVFSERTVFALYELDLSTIMQHDTFQSIKPAPTDKSKIGLCPHATTSHN